MRKTLLFICTLLSISLIAKEECGKTPHSKRLILRHLEGSGIGYDQGYTSLDLFFASPMKWNKNWVPFLDLRGHLFNDSHLAANGGFGARYLAISRVWGANIYYDYRNTNRKDYSQIGAGVESLGRVWDFRLNTYFPLGNQHSTYYQHGFDHFRKHYVILSKKREFSLKGFDAEIGAHVDHFKQVPLYFAAGPYYLDGESESSWGGKFRSSVDIFDYIRFEGEISYDDIYRLRGHGQISAIIPFGRRRKVQKGKQPTCRVANALSRRAFQRVDRHEIIPIDDVKKTEKALHPCDCTPYKFIFVDSFCSSNGTAESPFPSLTTAINTANAGDIIYVFPGDGNPYTTTGTFTLQDHQTLYGAGISHPLETQLGLIRIPAQSGTYPRITTSDPSGTVLTLANNNEVAGMHVVGNNILNGILGSDSSALVMGTLRENWIETSGPNGNRGIFLSNPTNTSANYNLVNNVISNLSAQAGTVEGIEIENDGANSNFRLVNNRISNLTASTGATEGISIGQQGENSTLHLLNNRIENLLGLGGDCVGIIATIDETDTTINLVDNRLSRISSAAGTSKGIDVTNSSGTNFTLRIAKNRTMQIFSTNNSAIGIEALNQAGPANVKIANNYIANISAPSSSSFGLAATNEGTDTTFVILENVTSDITGNTTSGISIASVAGQLCLVFIENLGPPSIELSRTGGTFTVDPSSQNNTPKPTSTGSLSYSACAP